MAGKEYVIRNPNRDFSNVGRKPTSKIDSLGRECTTCGIYKPFYNPLTKDYNYAVQKSSSTGFASTCNVCRNAKHQEQRERKNAENRADMDKIHRASSAKASGNDESAHYQWMNGDDDIFV